VAAADPLIREFSAGLSADAQPNAITEGPDSAMWFTERQAGKIGRIAPDGTITEYPPAGSPQLTSGALPAGIVSGPDGNIWFTEYGTGLIGDLNPATGKLIGEYAVGPNPEGMAVGSDGNIWVVLHGSRSVAQVVPNQVVAGTSQGITPYSLTNSDSGPIPSELSSGPDGNLWVTAGSTVYRVDPHNPPNGNAPAFDLSGNPSSNTNDAEGITVGPDGKLWATLFVGGQLAQIDQSSITSQNTTTGRTYFAVGGSPLWVSDAGDHALWLTDRGTNQLLRFDPVSHAVTSFGAAKGVTGDPNVDAQDSAGNLWFTEFNSDAIGEVVVALVNTVRPTVAGAASPAEVLSCSTGSWSPVADSFEYQWLRDGSPIAGATQSQYTLPADANGHSFACRVTAHSSTAGVSGTATSAAVGAAPLTNVSPPTITGQLKDSGVVTCNHGSWSLPDVGFNYLWFWNSTPPLSGLSLRVHQKAFGVKPGSKLFGELKNPLLGAFSLLSSSQTMTIPHLLAPTSFYCTVIATAKSGETAQASSTTVKVNPPPPALVRGGPKHDFARPSINPHVGVGGTNTCQPGRWSGGPMFSYAWYAITADRHTVSGKRYTLLGKGQTYEPAPADEHRTIDCWVTAKNPYGSHTELSNSYVVPLGAPSATGPLQVAVTTSSPATSGTIGPAGGGATAELVNLKCLGDNWNRSDVKVSYQWVSPYYSKYAGTHPESGQQLNLDMRPGHLQYEYLPVQCVATATTSHGISSTESSGVINVTNGCREDYTLDDLNYYTINIFGDKFHFTFQWLDGQPDASGGVTGAFGLVGFPIEGGHVPRRAVTWGPNCLDYQKYLLRQGFDVKQFDQNDIEWVNH
jgi:virginiamycin B lyase